MCTVAMSKDGAQRLSLLSRLRSVSPTVIGKTASLGPGFYLQRAGERHMH